MTIESTFAPLALEDLPALTKQRKRDGWRFVQILAATTDDGIDLIYTFMKDSKLENFQIGGVGKDDVVPSITDTYLAAFVFENEVHDLFGVNVKDIAIDFGGNFYALAEKEPMTIISPELKEAKDKARKAAAAKAAKEAAAREKAGRAGSAAAANAEFVSTHPDAKPAKAAGGIITPTGEDDLETKLAGMDPEKVARVRAAMAAKAKKAAEQAAAAQAEKDAELERKLAGMDPEKAARVRAAMQAKAKKEAAGQAADADSAKGAADDGEAAKKAEIERKIAGLDPDKAAKVKAALAAKAAREQAQAPAVRTEQEGA